MAVCAVVKSAVQELMLLPVPCEGRVTWGAVKLLGPAERNLWQMRPCACLASLSADYSIPERRRRLVEVLVAFVNSVSRSTTTAPSEPSPASLPGHDCVLSSFVPAVVENEPPSRLHRPCRQQCTPTTCRSIANPVPKGGKLLSYGLNHWDGLTRFLDEIDSNTVERSIRSPGFTTTLQRRRVHPMGSYRSGGETRG
jgi:transposase IS66 family protein